MLDRLHAHNVVLVHGQPQAAQCRPMLALTVLPERGRRFLGHLPQRNVQNAMLAAIRLPVVLSFVLTALRVRILQLAGPLRVLIVLLEHGLH